MRRAAKIALGVLFAPVGIFVIGLVAFGALRAAGVPDADVGSERIEQPVVEVPRTELRSVPPAEREMLRPDVDDVLRVELDLVEGHFRIEPHDGHEIEVEAEYDRATYGLDRKYDLDGDTPVFKLKFYSKLHWLRRLAQDGGISDEDFDDNEITVFLPANVPLDLDIKIARAEGEVVLDGLSLVRLVTDLSMGEYTLETNEPNPIPMARSVFELGMGEVTLRGLAYLQCSLIEVTGGMGEITVDMGTSLAVDTEIRARMRMGEMTLELPDDALFDSESSFNAFLGEVDDRGVRSRRVDDPEQARRLLVSGTVLMGALVVDEFRARSSLQGQRR